MIDHLQTNEQNGSMGRGSIDDTYETSNDGNLRWWCPYRVSRPERVDDRDNHVDSRIEGPRKSRSNSVADDDKRCGIYLNEA